MFAREAAWQLGLAEVLLMPSREAPHKRIEPEPGPDVRMEMTALASAGDPLLEASRIEIDRAGPSYTAETLETLAEQRPGDQLWFLMGADVAEGIESWSRPERVVELARLGIAARSGTVLDDVDAALESLGADGRNEVVKMPELGISSTRIRRRIAQGRPIRYLVPDAVIELIESKGLYR